MADTPEKAISYELDCGICQNRLEDPKMLNCGHTFCMTCLDALVANKTYDKHNISCPVCRADTELDKRRGTSSLRSNYAVKSVLEALRIHEKACSKKDFCIEHPRTERALFCEKCRDVICSECAVSNHAGHAHRVKNIKEVSQKKTEGIVDLLGKAATWTKSHEAYLRDTEDKKAAGNSALDRLDAEVQDSYQVRIAQLEDTVLAAKDTVLNDIRSKRASFNGTMDKLLQREKDAMSRVVRSTGFAEDLLDSSDPREVVVLYEDWAKSLNRDLRYKVPPFQEPRREFNSVKALRFEETAISIDDDEPFHQLGAIKKQTKKYENMMGTEVKEAPLRRPGRKLRLTMTVDMSGSIKTMAADPYQGSLLVGYSNGHLEKFFPDGSCTKLATNSPARDLAVLSDGRLVTLTGRNKITIYPRSKLDKSVEGTPSRRKSDGRVIINCDLRDFIDAVAVDEEDVIYLLLPETGMVATISYNEEDNEYDVALEISLNFPIKCGASEMTSTASGELLVVADDAVLTFDVDGFVSQRTPLHETERASCDSEGQIWVLSHRKFGLDFEMFLELYNRSGKLLADLHIPTFREDRGFEPWGIALSSTCYAAQITPTKLAWFVFE